MQLQRVRIREAKLVALLVAAVSLAGCDGGVHLAGQVVDSEGRPISGARVALQKGSSTPEFEATSEKSGCFSVGGLTAPGQYNFTVRVAAPGYKVLSYEVPTIERNAFRLVLAKSSQAFASQAVSLEASELESACGAI